MTAAEHDRLTAMSPAARTRARRESTKALRLAWPQRHGMRGRIVVESNATFLRNLRSIG